MSARSSASAIFSLRDLMMLFESSLKPYLVQPPDECSKKKGILLTQSLPVRCRLGFSVLLNHKACIPAFPLTVSI